MRRLRSPALATALTCFALVLCVAGPDPIGPPPVFAGDGAAGTAFYEKEFKGLAKAAAAKQWGLAEAAKKAGFNEFARAEAQRAIDYEPNHKEARKYLNYERKGSDWVRDTDAEGKTQKLNMKNAKESQKSFDNRVEKWKEQKRKVEAFIAAKYVQVGERCKGAGFDEQATKCFDRALGLDPTSSAARIAMGFVQVGTVWLTPKQKAAVEAAQKGSPVTETSRLEKGLGIRLNKMESPHFRVEDDAAAEALPETIKALETLYCYFLADVGRDPTYDAFEGKKIEFCVLSTQPPWEKWVDQFSNTADVPWTKENNTYRGYRSWVAGVKRVETAEHIDTRDPLLNHAAHFLSQMVWKAGRFAWLDEGLAYYYTIKVQGTTRTHSVAKVLGDYAEDPTLGGDKDWTVSERWKEFLGFMVKKKNDVDLRTIMTRPLATLDLPQSVKAWGVISWLMDTKREKFIELLGALRDGKEADQVEIFERVMGMGVESIDKEWREYAVRAY